MPIGKYISIITLNVNELNTPTKRYRLIEWIQKQDPYICCLQDMYFRPRDAYRLKAKGWTKIFHVNGNQKKSEVAILISEEIDFKEYYKSTRGTLHNEQGISPRRRHNNCKYLCTQHWSTPVHKANTDRHKKGN